MNSSPLSLRHAGLAALALWAAGAHALPPERATLHYQVIRNGSVLGEAVETIEHDGRNYTITSETTGSGILAMLGTLKRSSRGRITPQGLRPDEFRDRRPGGWAVSAKFDWEANAVTQERKGKAVTVKIPEMTQDPLSMVYSFAFKPPKGKEFKVTRADGRGLASLRFTIVGTEKLATPVGDLQTLRVARVPDGPDDKATDIWFAVERDFLPVRVLVVDKDGTRADQVVTRIGD